MNRGHRNFKSADVRVVRMRLQVPEELQPGETLGFGRSPSSRSHERLIAASTAPTLVAVAFSSRSHIARPLANNRLDSPVGKVFSSPTGAMIQGGSGEPLPGRVGVYGNQGKARKTSSVKTWAGTRQRRPPPIGVGLMSTRCCWEGHVFTRQAHLRRSRVLQSIAYALSRGVFVASISLIWGV